MEQTIFQRVLRKFVNAGLSTRISGVDFQAPVFLVLITVLVEPLILSPGEFLELEAALYKVADYLTPKSQYWSLVRTAILSQTLQWLKLSHPFPGLDESIAAYHSMTSEVMDILDMQPNATEQTRWDLTHRLEKIGQAVVDNLVPYIEKEGVQEAILKLYRVGKLYDLRFYVPPDKWR